MGRVGVPFFPFRHLRFRQGMWSGYFAIRSFLGHKIALLCSTSMHFIPLPGTFFFPCFSELLVLFAWGCRESGCLPRLWSVVFQAPLSTTLQLFPPLSQRWKGDGAGFCYLSDRTSAPLLPWWAYGPRCTFFHILCLMESAPPHFLLAAFFFPICPFFSSETMKGHPHSQPPAKKCWPSNPGPFFRSFFLIH